MKMLPDYNIDSDGDGKADLNIDSDGDGLADINIDLDGDNIPDINIDGDGDGIPDIDIDSDGDGIPDVNVDTDGDGKPDEYIKEITEWKPEKNVDGEPPYDTMDFSDNEDTEMPSNDDTDVKGSYYPGDNVGGAITGDNTNLSAYVVICFCTLFILLPVCFKLKNK